MLRLLVVALCFLAPCRSHPSRRRSGASPSSSATPSYQNTPELKNPKNDATDMAASLRRLGFEVFEGHDLDKRSMERMIRQFGVKLSGADLALFFYAGHGVAIGGQNYLVPIGRAACQRRRCRFRRSAADARPQADGTGGQDQHRAARCLSRQSAGAQPRAHDGYALVAGQPGPCRGEDRRRHADRIFDTAGQRCSRRRRAEFALRRRAAATYRSVRHRRQRRPHRGAQRRAQGNRRQAGAMGAYVAHRPSLSQDRAVEHACRGAAACIPSGTTTGKWRLSYWSSVKDSKSPALIQSYLDRYPNGNFCKPGPRHDQGTALPAGALAQPGRPASFCGRQGRAGAFAADRASTRGLQSRAP